MGEMLVDEKIGHGHCEYCKHPVGVNEVFFRVTHKVAGEELTWDFCSHACAAAWHADSAAEVRRTTIRRREVERLADRNGMAHLLKT